MLKRGEFKRYIIYFVFSALIIGGILLSFVNSQTTDLNSLDWIRTGIRDISYDSDSKLIYFVGDSGLFGVYNRTSGVSAGLNGTDTGDWIGNSNLNEVIYANGLVYFVGNYGIFGVYNPTLGVTEDLRGTDAGNWVGTITSSNIQSLAYDSDLDLIYFVGGSSIYNATFGVYNRTSNVTEDLRTTDTNDWFGNVTLMDVSYDSSSGLIYLAGERVSYRPRFGAYNRSSNVTVNLTARDANNWLWNSPIWNVFCTNNGLVYLTAGRDLGVYNVTAGNSTLLTTSILGSTEYAYINDLDYNSADNLIYIVGDDGAFGFYNITSNITSDLRGDDNWFGILDLYGTVYDSDRKLTYIGGYTGTFGAYNKTTNITENLRATTTNDWIAITFIYGLAYDSVNDLTYVGGYDGLFGVYNRISNTIGSLRTADTGNWVGYTNLLDLVYDSDKSLIYLAGEYGKFGFYNLTSNITTDLTGTDTGDWIGTEAFGKINELEYDPNNDLIYIAGGASSNRFGFYNRSSNIATNLNDTDTENWLGTSYLHALAYDSNHDLIYLGGWGEFGFYNRTLNVSTNLNDTDTGNWMYNTITYGLAYDPNNDLVYIAGSGGKFGVYNRITNISTNLSNTDTDNWVGTTVFNDVVYDSVNNLAYFAGDSGKFGVYNRTSNVMTDLSDTDTGDWIGGNTIYRLAYDSTYDLVYLAGSSGIFGAYNGTSGTTSSLEEGVANDIVAGGADLLSTTQTETQNIDTITAGGSVSISIGNRYIDIRNITLSARANISNASITISENETETGNIRIKFPVGTVYQAFSISTRAISNENLNNVTIEFRVNKTWIEQNNRSVNDVVLYRVPTSQEVWEALTTTSIREDSVYYYFLAVSPGFSTFVVFVGEPGTIGCIPSQRRCFNDELQVCSGNGIWTFKEQCQYKCENSQCVKAFLGLDISVSIYYGILILVSLGIATTLYLIFVRIRKRRK